MPQRHPTREPLRLGSSYSPYLGRDQGRLAAIVHFASLDLDVAWPGVHDRPTTWELVKEPEANPPEPRLDRVDRH